MMDYRTQAALWMLAGMAMFSIEKSITHYVAPHSNPFIVAFFQYSFALVCFLPAIWKRQWRPHWVPEWRGLALRALCSGVTTVMLVLSLRVMPLAEVTTMVMTGVILVLIGGKLILRERVGVWRWGASIAGLLGAAVILRPGLALYHSTALLPLVSALMFAGASLLTRSLSKTLSAFDITLYLLLMIIPISAIPAAFFLSAVRWELLPYFMLMGATFAGIQFCVARAYGCAEASFVAPYSYARLPLNILIGVLAFGEVPTIYAWAGMLLITVSCFVLWAFERPRLPV